MKNIDNNLKILLNNNPLGLKKCFKIVLNSGEILAFTEHSENLIIDNIIFESSNGFEEINNQTHSDLSVNNSKVVGLLNSNTLKIDEVLSGKFDDAKVEIFYIHLDDINFTKIPIISGNITSINLVDGKIYFSIADVINVLNKTIGEVYSPLCRAKFCDHKCSLNIENYTFFSQIATIKGETEFLCNSATTDITNKPKNYFKYGVITFLDGKNANQSTEIKQSYGNDIILNTKMNYSLNIGDSFKIVAGCNKTFETCIERFNNAINFRGEPNIPNTTKVYKFY